MKRSKSTYDKILSGHEWRKHLRFWGKRDANKRTRSRVRRIPFSNYDSDTEALASDWRAVGDDLRYAITRFEEEHSELK